MHRFARPPAPNDTPPAPSGGGGGAPPSVPVAQPPGPPVATAPPSAPPPITMPAPSRPTAPQPHHEPSPARPSGATDRDLEELSGLRKAKADLAAEVARLQGEKAAAEQQAHKARQMAVMATEIQHPDVQRLFHRGYEDYVLETKEAHKAPVDFEAWYRSEHVRQSPVYGVHFRAPPTVAGGPGQPPPPVAPPAPPPARVEGGERGAPRAPGPVTITDEQIAEWSRDPRAYAAHREEILAAQRAKYGREVVASRKPAAK